MDEYSRIRVRFKGRFLKQEKVLFTPRNALNLMFTALFKR